MIFSLFFIEELLTINILEVIHKYLQKISKGDNK
jgi:hypothetical protein